VNNPESSTYYPRTGKNLPHFFRGGVGHDIEVFRALFEQQITNTTPDQIRAIPCCNKGFDNLPSTFTDIRRTQPMDLRTEHTWRDRVFPLGATFRNKGLQEFLNQEILVPA